MYHGVVGYMFVPDNESTEDIIKEVWYENVYEIHPDYVKNSTVVDIGANFGAFSAWCASAGASNVYSFEPMRQSYEVLRLNSFLHPSIQIFNSAVLDDGGFVEVFTSSDSDPGSTAVVASSDGGQIRSVSLNSVLRSIREDVAFLKVDAEGSEYDIFRAVDIDLLKKVKRISMEFHGPSMYSFIDSGYFGTMIEKLAEWGTLRVIGRPSNGGFVHGVSYE